MKTGSRDRQMPGPGQPEPTRRYLRARHLADPAADEVVPPGVAQPCRACGVAIGPARSQKGDVDLARRAASSGRRSGGLVAQRGQQPLKVVLARAASA